MTTHDEQTLTDSYDESQTEVAETPPVDEQRTPEVSAQPTPEPSAPPPDVAEEQGPSSVAPAESSTAVESGEAAKHSSVERESSTEEVLFADDELEDLRGRWAGVQAAFVDDPKDCVQKADVLVSDLVEQLTTGFAGARSRLEEQWARGEEASTEDLRVALMHYREFFERLLAV
ncbi:MAG: hypothetical protein WBZ37_02750 [Mycobacterium sp.]